MKTSVANSEPIKDLTGSQDRFGYEWQHYSEIKPEHEEQFRCWTAHVTPDDWRGK